MSYNLSIVIPVFNKWNFTRDCLRDLFRLNLDHEIIVVDNGSKDETCEKIASFQNDLINEYETALNNRRETKDILPLLKARAVASPLIYERFPENRGFAAACNHGYRVASGPNVLFLNNDIRVSADHHNWTEPLIRLAFDGKLVGPTVGHLNQQFDFVREDDSFSDGTLIDYLSGWCLAGSKHIFDKLDLSGGKEIFSEDFFCYFEDTDLSIRAKKLGVSMETTKVPVTHFGKISSRQLDVSTLYKNARAIFVKKWENKIK